MARRTTALAVTLALGLGTAACGGTAEPAAEGDGAPVAEMPATGASSAYPVTIEHAAGRTTIEERPERVVSLSVQWTDALLAMDVLPAAYVLDQVAGEEDPYPWQGELLQGSTRIDSTGELPLERIATLQPDLILVTHAATDPELFDRLERIAPTIGLLGDAQVDSWRDQLDVLGRALDAGDQAQRIAEEVDARIAAVADDLPALEGATYALANYVPGDGIYAVADPDDGASDLFDRLGMSLEPALLEAADEVTGRAHLSFEQVGLLDADLLAILPNDGDPHDLPGYGQLTAVRSGAVAEMAFTDVVGLNTPSPLSIPHVLEVLRPALGAVGGA